MRANAIARAICPLAPFLVPKSVTLQSVRSSVQIARDVRRLAFSTFVPQGPYRELVRESIKKRHKESRRSAFRTELGAYRDDLYAGDFKAGEEGFGRFLTSLQQQDVRNLVRSLHRELRRRAAEIRSFEEVDNDDVLAFADRIVLAMREGRIPLERNASMHLISLYKEAKAYSKGEEFWRWLVRQGDDDLDTKIYGAAIELLAYQGIKPLQELEDLYQAGLRLVPGSYPEYNLSANALLPNRSKFTTIHQLPIMLLQGIFTARMLHGDWRNGYLAFDTALRLLPTQTPPRYFDFIIRERPLPEAYKVFHLSCRSLLDLRKPTMVILSRLLSTQISPLDVEFDSADLRRNLIVVEAMMDAFKAAMNAGSPRGFPLLSRLTRAFAYVRIPVSAKEEHQEAFHAYNAWLSDRIEQLVLRLSPLLEATGLGSNNMLISLGREFEDKALALRAFQRIQGGVTPPDFITYSNMIKVAGRCGYLADMEVAWHALVNYRLRHDDVPSESDWIHFAVAVKEMKQLAGVSFIETQMLQYGITEELQTRLRDIMNPAKWDDKGWFVHPSFQEMDLEGLKSRIDRAVEDLVLHVQNARLKRTSNLPTLDLYARYNTTQLKANKDQLREIYDGMTTDPARANITDTGAPDADELGNPVALYRFENWATINELLELAEGDAKFKSWLAAESEASGKTVDELQRDPKVTSRYDAQLEADEIGGNEQSQAGVALEGSTEALRERIMSLRGLNTQFAQPSVP